MSPKNKKPAGGRAAKNFEPRYGEKKSSFQDRKRRTDAAPAGRDGARKPGSKSPGHRGYRPETEDAGKRRWTSQERAGRDEARGIRSQSRTDRPRFDDDRRPSRERGAERPRSFDRDDRRAPRERDGRPAYRGRDDRPARDRDDRGFSRDRGQRDERPNRDARDSGGWRRDDARGRDDRPARRDDRVSRMDRVDRDDRRTFGDAWPSYRRDDRVGFRDDRGGFRQDRPRRDGYDADDRARSTSRDDRPRRDERSRFDRDDRARRDDRPRFDRDDGPVATIGRGTMIARVGTTGRGARSARDGRTGMRRRRATARTSSMSMSCTSGSRPRPCRHRTWPT